MNKCYLHLGPSFYQLAILVSFSEKTCKTSVARTSLALPYILVMRYGATEINGQLFQSWFFGSKPKEKGAMEPVRPTDGAHMAPTPAPSETP